MSDLFKDILPAIMQTKQNVLVEEKDYIPYIVNKALSFHRDCILFANQMNMNPNLDKKMQFEFLLNTVRAKKRPFQKWLKKETIEDVKLLQEYFDYSEEKARDALRILSSAELEQIRSFSDKGGVNDRTKRTNRGETKRT